MRELEPRRPGPRHPGNSILKSLEHRILNLKQTHPSWGARRIKHQYDLPCHWTTVHRVIKRHGMLVRIKAKPQPSKRFQRYHVDSMWQGDTFEFRIAGVGKVYVTGFTDDRSRYRIRSGVISTQEREGGDRRSAARPPETEGPRGRRTSTTANSSSRRSSRQRWPGTTSSRSTASRTIREAEARSRDTTRSSGGS